MAGRSIESNDAELNYLGVWRTFTANLISSTRISPDHRSERQIAKMIQRLLQNAMR